GRGERLSGAGRAHKHLEPLALAVAVHDLLDRLRLIASRPVVADKLKLRGHVLHSWEVTWRMKYYTREQVRCVWFSREGSAATRARSRGSALVSLRSPRG